MKKINILFIFLLFAFDLSAQNFDVDLLKKLNAPNPVEAGFWRTISSSVYVIPVTYLAGNVGYGLAANDSRALRYALEGTLSLGFSTALMELMKNTIKRPRPATAYPDLIRTYSATKDYSFPSGHSSVAFTAATTMSYQIAQPAVNIPVFIWPISVGYSRMRLGKHYPTDVLAGTIIGIGSGILGHWVTTKIEN